MNTDSLILKIVGKALFHTSYTIPPDIDSEQVFAESLAQGVFPIVYEELQSNLDITNQVKWMKRYTQVLAHNIKVNNEHLELHNLLGSIPYTTFKGLQSSLYYPKPILRTLGDVDFIVDKHDVEKVQSILEQNGFQWNGDGEHTAHHAFHRGESSVWELHWMLTGIPKGESGDIAKGYLESIIADAVVIEQDGRKCKVVSEFHHCLVMLTHTAGHMIHTGVGLRHICDWAVFVSKVDISQWEEQLKACGLWRFAQLLTQLSEKYLSLQKQEWTEQDVDERLLKALIQDIFAGGNFGIKDSERINQAKLMTDNEIGGVDKTCMWIRAFREIDDRAKIAVPRCRNVIFLRPLAWVFVCVRHLGRIRKGLRPKIKLNDMIKGAAERRTIYREFQLYQSENKRK